MITIKIEGMNCEHCVAAVTRALEGVPGIKGVIEVRLDLGYALVDGEPNHEVLTATIEEAGYRAKVSP